MVQPPVNLRTFEALRQVVTALRGPDGCPWDKEQTHRSLTPYAIEEAFELVDAIEMGSRDEIVEELGDYLLQVVLHAELGRQDADFTLEDVLEAINSKMIRRHPHVFGDTPAKNSDEVLANWAVLKSQEKPKPSDSFGLPTGLPALQKAQKIGGKTKGYAFDWTQANEVLAKVEEELGELRAELVSGNQQRQQAEMGDLLFSLAQLSRHLGFEAEQALRETNRRFETRFFKMLGRASQLPGSKPVDLQAYFKELPAEQKEELWRQVKAAEGATGALDK
jgi:tetrapyrrole methylase family protein/MazG family protein